MKHFFSLLSLLIFFLPNQETQAQDAVEDYFSPVKYRSIGPFRGGRSVAAQGLPHDPLTAYMGITGGGVWKTSDAGQHWDNISDGYFKTGSVGALSVAPNDDNVIYVGMGEHAPRGVMSSHGDGVYKSTDAGKSWQHLGLTKTRQIAGIVVHPDDSDHLYVAAQGAYTGASQQRGVYRSKDGGKSWKKVLYVDENTGCSHLIMDPNNPRILYGAMWDHRRYPWQVRSGGPGSGIYKSTDGGSTWEQLEKGLPEGLGKMSLAMSADNSEKIYALIESDSDEEKGGLFVSNNAGKSWSHVSKDHRLVQRAWYYIEVFADPQDENTIYVLNSSVYKSIDGGKNWSRIGGTHGDHHHLWINPTNSRHLVLANDGGAAISFNGGKSWSTQANMPTAQFYRINVDNHFPYRIYAGQQDNSSVRIENRNISGSSISTDNWTRSAGGESAFLAFNPDDPRIVLGGSYQGTIVALDSETQEARRIMAAPEQFLARDAKDMPYRFNWNAPILWDRHTKNTFYHAGNKVLATNDLGKSWQEISPDLTRNEIEKQGKGGAPFTNEGAGGENYGTISYLTDSPHAAGELWVGSDDGLVQLTRDGGKTWNNITPKGLEECLIN
ncbi:MAG: glycosyl hydrolase, partial [Bacteroidota bacterium]